MKKQRFTIAGLQRTLEGCMKDGDRARSERDREIEKRRELQTQVEQLLENNRRAEHMIYQGHERELGRLNTLLEYFMACANPATAKDAKIMREIQCRVAGTAAISRSVAGIERRNIELDQR